MSGINAIGSNTKFFTNTTRIKKAKNQSSNADELRKDFFKAEEQHAQKLKNNEDDKGRTIIKEEAEAQTEETQTEIFVNPQGERIVAIKTPFGSVRYIKIGELTDFLLSDNKASADIESLEKA